MKAQRLRFRYRLTDAALNLGHRDIVNGWIGAVTAAGCQVTLSEGKRPSPQVSLGAPLPAGVTSDCEFVDVFLAEPVAPASVLAGVRDRLPSGIEAVSVAETSVGGSSLQAELRWAEYEVAVPRDGLSRADIEAKVATMLSAHEMLVEREREKGVKRFDLRPLVLDVRLLCEDEGSFTLRLRLRAEANHTARADDTIAALGLPPATRTHRVRLHLEEIPAIIAAYRRHGEPDRV